MAVSNVLLVSGSANFSTRDVWDGYRHALVAAGMHVVPYSTFSFLDVLSADAVCNDIIGTALDVDRRFDAVIFVDGLYFRGRRTRVPRSIRRAGVPTVLIATDDPYVSLPDVEALYTYRFTNEIRSAGDGVEYLPTATLHLPEIPRPAKPMYDVSFLGSVFEDRLPLLLRVAEFCEARGLRFLVAGKILGDERPFERFAQTDVRLGTINNVEKWDVYSQSRVTLNLFREAESPADSPNPRVFEVTAFGQAGLVTGPRRGEVTDIFGDTVYHFDDAEEVVEAIDEALSDDADRIARVERAQRITLAGHTYDDRAERLLNTLRSAEQAEDVAGTREDRVAWIIGCGRTGSTWLAEMLGDLPRIRRWHEPYFGRLFRHVQERPNELERGASFFANRHRDTWLAGLRNAFFEMVRERYPRFGHHALVVKEVNTPELHPWLMDLFPTGRVILLVRDPFDTLDSYLDLQRPGSWNDRFGSSEDRLTRPNVERTAEHIREGMATALQAFETWPLEQRLRIDYERMLDDAAPALFACGELVGIDLDPEEVAAVVAKHDFGNYDDTGPLAFRRQGKAGAWRTSENFTPMVTEIAERRLGPLRSRLGYE